MSTSRYTGWAPFLRKTLAERHDAEGHRGDATTVYERGFNSGLAYSNTTQKNDWLPGTRSARISNQIQQSTLSAVQERNDTHEPFNDFSSQGIGSTEILKNRN